MDTKAFNKLLKKIVLTYKIDIVTGLHIGASNESIEIGGIDKTIIRRGIDGIPYIPGSSIKGKIRCLLEQTYGASSIGNCKEVNNVFGITGSNLPTIPSKIIFRDAFLSTQSKKVLEDCEALDLPFSEVKMENSIKRVEGTAENPRKVERIPAGAEFLAEIVINVWNSPDDGNQSMALLEKGIRALENDYLGGNGSRGYGQVKFELLNKNEISFENYFNQ